MRTLLITWIAAAGAALAAEPNARLSTPVLGYVFDSNARAIRPIVGVPGAASLDPALPTASKLQIGFVSPNRQWLLAVMLEGGVELVDLRSGSATVLQGAPEDVALGAWSSDSTAIAILGRAGVLQVWAGLPESLKQRFSQSAELVDGIAVVNGGNSALLWSDSGLFSVDAHGTRQMNSEPIKAAAYRPGSSQWVAISGTQLFGSDVEARPLNLQNPTAVSFTRRGVLVAGRSGLESIWESNGSSLLTCDCEPTVLEPLAGTDVFRLTGLNASALAIYDGSETEIRLSYIPIEGGRQ